MKYEIIILTNLSEHIKTPDYKNHVLCIVDTGFWYPYLRHPMYTSCTISYIKKLNLDIRNALLLMDQFNQDLWYDRFPEDSLDTNGTIVLPEFGRIKLSKDRNNGEGYTWKRVRED